MHRFRPRLTYANAMSTVAVFIALGGGAYAAVSSSPGSGSVIHGCYKKKGGSLRLVAADKRCSRGERAIAFNQQGPAGSRGIQGVTGSPGASGAKGEQGPQGPGATTFATTLEQGLPKTTLATLGNGVTLTGHCVPGEAELVIETAGPGAHLQMSGTGGNSSTPGTFDFNNTSSSQASGGKTTDFNVIARDSTVGKFARIDAHGQEGSPCTFWGVIIPSG
jgi:hypothetical protein